MVDGSKWRLGGPGIELIVKTDQDQILRHPLPGAPQHLQRRSSRHIVAGHDGGERRRRLQQLPHGLQSPHPGMVTISHQLRVVRKPVLVEDVLIRLQPLDAVASVRLSGDEGDVLVSMLDDEMLDGLPDACGVIGGDGWAFFAGAHEDHRTALGLDVLQKARAGLCIQRGNGDQTIGVPGAHRHKAVLGGVARPGWSKLITHDRQIDATGQEQITAPLSGSGADATPHAFYILVNTTNIVDWYSCQDTDS